MTKIRFFFHLVAGVALCVLLISVSSLQLRVDHQGSRFTFSEAVGSVSISQTPLFLSTVNVPPHVMLDMSNDNQLFFTAYPEYADLTGDGATDSTYNHDFDYYGYFDSYKCYTYNSDLFEPASNTADKFCNGSQWSGNFLNWLTMARIDVVRKILYGGYRSTDTGSQTILERTYLPNDAHSWVRFYEGNDLNQLTPFSSGDTTSTTSPTSEAVVTGSRRGSGDRFWIDTPGWGSSEVQLGDQLEMTHKSYPGLWMRGVVVETDLSRSTPRIRLQVTGSENPQSVDEELGDWDVVNKSRRGVSFCNTTVATGASHGNDAINAPPLLMVAEGDYSLWTANERWQCRWREDVSPNVPDRMRLHNQPFMNGNDVVSSGLWSNADSPRRNDVRIGEFVVRVEVCDSDFLGKEDCKPYPDGNHKPFGLLQQFGEEGAILFGLMTGSYTNHVSGGVLRKNIGSFADEVNPDTGQFTLPTDSLVRSLDALRIFGYSHGSGEYTAGAENCVFGTSKSQMVGGRCYSWGNPQAEIYAESLRYLAGLTANTSFTHTGNDRIPGLTAATWNNPLTEDLWCAPLDIIHFNASVTSFDGGASAAASDLPGLGALSGWTNKVGSGEGLAGASVFAGGSTGFCTAETIGNLADFSGICPEAPNQDGTYHIAGLAHYAYTSDLRPTWQGKQTVKTYGVSLAPAVPRIEIPLPDGAEPVVILPACDNRGDDLRCQLAAFRIVDRDDQAGTGSFFIQWDVSEWGADFDMDINGTLSYVVDENEISVTTQTWADSSGRETGFGYIISGTDNDGFHAHSGINQYWRTNAGSVPNCTGCNVGDPPTTATFNLGSGTAQLLREPLFYAAKWGGYNKNRANFPANQATWDNNSDGAPDNYYFAIDPRKLAGDLAEVFGLVLLGTGSASAVATNTTRVQVGDLIYQARFRSDDWTGELRALKLDEAGVPMETPEWDAGSADKMPAAAQRAIFTFNPDEGNGAGVAFSWSALSGIQQAQLGVTADDPDQALGEQRLDWLRGVRTQEQQNGGMLRDRSRTLGDIVNSNPVVVKALTLRYERLPSDFPGRSSYPAYVQANLGVPGDSDNPGRRAMLYVGANDGMLHAFDAETGVEQFAYVPNLVMPELYKLTQPDYNHRYFVDGQFSAGDVYFDDEWRTILIGGLGAGGRGIFALDVTDPDNFSASDVLWEFTDPDLGHVMHAPIIRPMANGKWVALFGNGYNSDSGKAFLFAVDVETGDLIKKIDTEVGSLGNANGLAAPAVLAGPDRIVQTAYAGDLRGNVWRFDLSDSNPRPTQQQNGWTSKFRSQGKPAPLFVAYGPAGDRQPITAPMEVMAHPNGGDVVIFGTGRYFAVGDNVMTDNEPIQSLYGIWDKNAGNNPSPVPAAVATTRDTVLLRQQVEYEEIIEIAGEQRPVRVTSNNAMDWTGKYGWYIDLVPPSNIGLGERIVYSPIVRDGVVFIPSLVPAEDACVAGGRSFIYGLNALTGSRVEEPVLDVERDGYLDDGDLVEIEMQDGTVLLPVSAIGTGDSIASAGQHMELEKLDGAKNQICFSKTDGEIECIDIKNVNRGTPRASWRQIR